MKSVHKSNIAISQHDYWISKPCLNVCILSLLGVPLSMWRSEENLAGVASLSVWVLGMDLRSPGWMASAFLYCLGHFLGPVSSIFQKGMERINNRMPVT